MIFEGKTTAVRPNRTVTLPPLPIGHIIKNIKLPKTTQEHYALHYDKVSANGASSDPKASKFQSGHRVVKNGFKHLILL